MGDLHSYGRAEAMTPELCGTCGHGHLAHTDFFGHCNYVGSTVDVCKCLAFNVGPSAQDELLQAAKACIVLFEAWRDGIFARQGIQWVSEPPAIQKARAAIARAEGVK